eukprot:TRINITY_DN73699_c0_g1_i1.p1 TRINITY_DN73699_c0_g1~~TRINITY_DN73699_c0_g1_i1.p1  ORF type:complete len:304 (+),score=90.12 TRINITY_DN73699_c0_g1_i1:90-1001(+)
MSSLCLHALLLLTLLAGVSSGGLAGPTGGHGLAGKAAPSVLPRIHNLDEFDGHTMEAMLLREDDDAVEIETEAQPETGFVMVGDSNTSESTTFPAVILDFLALLPNILVGATTILIIRMLGLLLLPAYFSPSSAKRIEEEDDDEDAEIIDDEPASMDVSAPCQSKRSFAAQKTDECGCTALHMAAHEGRLTELIKLLEAGTDPNAREVWGEMPLHMAARAGSTEACDTLLAHGADLDAVNDDGETPLVVAAQAGHEITCKFLLEKGAGAGDADDVDMPPMLCSLLMLDLLPKEATSLSEDCQA